MEKNDALERRLTKLLTGIRSHPELHAKTSSFGAWVYDLMDLIEGVPYYIRISFDWNPENNQVEILSQTVVEANGPH